MSDRVLKKIADQKLRAFSIGSMGNRNISKRKLEEMKKKEQEEAAAQVFEEFVATFEETPNAKVAKTWIKAGTYDAGKRQEDAKEKGKIYRPQPKLDTEKSSAQRAEEYARKLSDARPDKQKKKKEGEKKKKTNLEIFKEELRMIQQEREERHKLKGVIKAVIEEPDPTIKSLIIDDTKLGSYDTGDPHTTNLYLGNLNPKITEQQLMEVFGEYGPLASIKIMWPRSEEEKARGRNCGFVAYMSRRDGERALRGLNGKDVMQYEMKLGWGKGVPIPPYPIYVPPKLLALTLPPAASGLPFNAQPAKRDKQKAIRLRNPTTPEDAEKLKEVLQRAVIKVVTPTDRNLLMLMHHMIEFVIREGPMFEAMIMNKEINNPLFRFLFDNKSPSHIYYRWKLYSMLQGDNPKEWRTEEFRMFKGGSIWQPPAMNLFLNGMPEELVEDEIDLKGTLSRAQRERLQNLLRDITPGKMKIAEIMVFCIEHAEASEEICEVIADSLSNIDTPLYRKVARLYVVSDILHNSKAKMPNASNFHISMKSRLSKIFEEVRKSYLKLEDEKKMEALKKRVLIMFKAWNSWHVYPSQFLLKLENIFLGLSNEDIKEVSDSEMEESFFHFGKKQQEVNKYISNKEVYEELDGVPLDGAALLKSVGRETDNDLDGVPLDDDIDGIPLEDDRGDDNKNKAFDRSAAFVPSRWESVDPEEAEAQAMTTSKWELLDSQMESSTSSDTPQDKHLQQSGFSEDDRRAKLREIEVKVMQYQDELEVGKRSLKDGCSIQQQVEHHRRKLLRKAERQQEKDDKKDKEQQGSSKKAGSLKNDTPTSGRYRRSRSASHSPTYRRLSPASHKSASKRTRPRSPSPPHKRKLYSPDSPSNRSRHHREERSPPSAHSYSRYKSRRSESHSPPRMKYSRGHGPSPPRKMKHKLKR